MEKWTMEARDFPHLLQVREGAIVGDFSMSLLRSKLRLILPEVALKPFGVYQSPTELVRDYLSSKYKLPLPIRKANVEAVSSPRCAPLLARVGEYGEGQYIDLKSAYWQIVRAVSWNCEYWPGRWVAGGESMADCPDFILASKPGRASMVSCARPSYMTIWNGHKLEHKRSFSTMINYRLVALVMDVLNGVAADIKRACPSLVYVNTDGYIVEDRDVRTAYGVLKDWGLVYGTKASGKIRVDGVGSYSVGRFKSKRPGNGVGFDNLDFELSDWLRPRFSKFASLQAALS